MLLYLFLIEQNKSRRSLQVLRTKLKSYIRLCMRLEPTDLLADTLGIFIWANQMKRCSINLSRPIINLEQRIKEIKESLRRFSVERFLEIMKYPGMVDVILHFSSICNLNLLNEDEQKGFEILKIEWTKQISKLN